MRATTKKLLASVAAVALFAGACGDDDDTATTPPPGADDDGAQDGGVTVTLTADSLEVPSEIPGGVVEITVDNQAGADEFEVGFARVTPGTSEDAFRTAILAAFQGEAIDPLVEAAVGVAGGPGSATESVILEEGEYFVFAQAPSEDEGGDEGGEGGSAEAEAEGGAETGATGAEADAEAETETARGQEGEGGEGEGGEEGDGGGEQLLIAATTVTEAEPGELPETDGTITAVDYDFQVDVQAGDAFTFVNDGPEQFHHAVLFNFGTADPELVEEHIIPFLESEGQGADLPAELTGALPGDPFAGGSAVASPGLGGTFRATLESGNTYAAVCYIADRSGGAPHVFAHQMYEVFTVS